MQNEAISLEIKEGIFNFHRNVKFLRKKAGLTTHQMAGIIGVSEQTLILAESCTDTNCFYDIHIKNICRYFTVGADFLFYEKLY